MVADSITRTMGICPISRPRWYSLSPSFSGNEKRVRQRDVSLRCNGFPEVTDPGLLQKAIHVFLIDPTWALSGSSN